jgi:hypothetical protein
VAVIAREHGFHTAGWVNDFFLVGYSALGVERRTRSAERSSRPDSMTPAASPPK